MSYILDALRKADRDRNLGEVPGIETAHWGARRHAHLPRWVWIVAGLLLVNGLFLLFLLERDSPLRTADIEEQQADVAAESPLAVPVPPEPVALARPENLRPRVKPRPVPAPAPAVRQARQPQVTMAEPASQPVPASPPSRPKPVSQDEYDVPEWRDMSLEFRSGLSMPRIDVHVYSEDPDRRFIMADLKKYREGETLANGAVLEKIYPGSIQLNYQGTRFRMER